MNRTSRAKVFRYVVPPSDELEVLHDRWSMPYALTEYIANAFNVWYDKSIDRNNITEVFYSRMDNEYTPHVTNLLEDVNKRKHWELMFHNVLIMFLAEWLEHNKPIGKFVSSTIGADNISVRYCVGDSKCMRPME